MRRTTVVQAAACFCVLFSGVQPSFAGVDAPTVPATGAAYEIAFTALPGAGQRFIRPSPSGGITASLPDSGPDDERNATSVVPDIDPRSSVYTGLISTYARQFGVPVDLAHAVIRVESNYDPKARGSAGEIGLMQIKPATARMMGYRGGRAGLFDPETNIRFGMRYLARAHELSGGFTCGTILRYNAGHGATRMNPVSRRYCGKVQTLLDL